MARIRLVDEGVVYRNTNPGYEFHFACHSHLVRLTPQELLCTFQRGQALYSVDSVMVQGPLRRRRAELAERGIDP